MKLSVSMVRVNYGYIFFNGIQILYLSEVYILGHLICLITRSYVQV